MENIYDLISDMSLSIRTNTPSWLNEDVKNIDFYRLFLEKLNANNRVNNAQFLLNAINKFVFVKSELRNKLLINVLVNGDWVIDKYYKNKTLDNLLTEVKDRHSYIIGVQDTLYIYKDINKLKQDAKLGELLAELEECLKEKFSNKSFKNLYRICTNLSVYYSNTLVETIFPEYTKEGLSGSFISKLSDIIRDLEELGYFLGINVLGKYNEKWFNLISSLYRKDSAKEAIKTADKELTYILKLIHNDLIDEWTPDLLALAVNGSNYKQLMKHDKWGIVPTSLSYIFKYVTEDNYKYVVRYCESEQDFENEVSVITDLRKHLPKEVIDVKYNIKERKYLLSKEELEKRYKEELKAYKKNKDKWASNKEFMLYY